MALTKTPIELSSTPSIVDGGNATAITIDSSERVLIGKTGTGLGTSGTEINPNGYVQITEDQSPPLYLNRLTTDGSIINFYKDGTTVGSIGTIAGYLTTGTSDTGVLFHSGENSIQPWNIGTNAGRDNAISLGASNARFKDLYLSGGAYLGGTGAANYLNDYEEGTWTPTDDSGAGLAITVNDASYTRIGRLCYIYGYINYPTNSSSAAQQLGGLPFPTKVADTYAQLTIRIVNNALSTEHVTLQLQTNSSYGRIHYATTIPDNADLSGTSFLISGVYEVA